MRRSSLVEELLPAAATRGSSQVTGGCEALGALILELTHRLQVDGVPHAFLRGHEALPRVRPGSDVDMLVPAPSRARFEELLEAVCVEHGARVWQRFRAGFLTQLILHARMPDARHAFLSLDLHSCEACFGVPFLEPATLLPDGPSLAGLPCVRPAAGAVADFLGPYLSGAVVHGDYARRLGRVLAVEPRAVSQQLSRLFGERLGAELVGMLTTQDLDGLRARARRARRVLLARRFLRAPLRSLAGLSSFGYGARLRPLWRPRGLFLAFLGTDGAGKSTVLEALERELAPAFRSTRSGTWHLRPMVLPQLDTLVHLGRSTYTLEDMSRPHRAKPSGRLVSNLRVGYYWLDYVVGYAWKVLPRRRRASLILFDRYFYDYLVDPLRCRVRRGTLLARVLARWVPRPDEVVVVSADFERVRARKQELSPEESAFQLAAYEALAASQAGYHLVRNDGTVEEAVRSVLDHIFAGDAA
jgi:thymidylate kinase